MTGTAVDTHQSGLASGAWSPSSAGCTVGCQYSQQAGGSILYNTGSSQSTLWAVGLQQGGGFRMQASDAGWAICPNQAVKWWLVQNGEWSSAPYDDPTQVAVRCAGYDCSHAQRLDFAQANGNPPTISGQANTSHLSPSSTTYSASCIGGQSFSGTGPTTWIKLVNLPPRGSVVSVTTCDPQSTWDTDLSVWKGASCAATLTQVTCNGDAPSSASCQSYYSSVTFTIANDAVTADFPFGSASYWVRVGGYNRYALHGIKHIH